MPIPPGDKDPFEKADPRTNDGVRAESTNPNNSSGPEDRQISAQRAFYHANVRQALRRAEVQLFGPNFYRKPFLGGWFNGYIRPEACKIKGREYEVIRAIFSRQSFDETTQQPVQVVSDYALDYQNREITRFGGRIEGMLEGEGALARVIWLADNASPPLLEYGSVSNSLEVTLGSAYEASRQFSLEYGLGGAGESVCLSDCYLLSAESREDARITEKVR